MVICHKNEAEGDEYGCHKNEAEGDEYGYVS
jgi:hypothetical protein